MITEKDMMHGHDYSGQDVTDWLMSEKLNGCRAYWDGETMWSRGGNVINIPSAMRAALPSTSLDGEIYAGRDGFEAARKAVQYGRFTTAVKFVAFDLPESSGAFYQRYEALSILLPEDEIVSYAEHIDCAGIAAAVDFMSIVQAGAGEGVVLRNPYALYTPGVGWEVLKLKEAP
jgi:DNA ligase 1